MSSSASILTFEELAAFGPVLEQRMQQAANLLKVTAGRFVYLEIVERSPVGHPGNAPLGHGGGDLHPGLFRASTFATLGAPAVRTLPRQSSYPIPGAGDYDAAVAGCTYTVAIFIVNAAAEGAADPYSWVLERGRVWAPLGGRKFAAHVPRRGNGAYNIHRQSRRQMGRWYGSVQAPDGVFGPAIRAVWVGRARVLAAALAEIERLI